MTYEMYRYVFLGGVVLAVIMLLVSVFVFFFLNIPMVIGDLTGANARKAIENIRNQNENSGVKTYKSSVVNHKRGRLTDKISPSGKIERAQSLATQGAMPTAKISTQELVEEHKPAAETTVLSTELPACETTVLSMINKEQNNVTESNMTIDDGEFVVEFEITYIHTDEIIA